MMSFARSRPAGLAPLLAALTLASCQSARHAPGAATSTRDASPGEPPTQGFIDEGIAMGFLKQDDPKKPLRVIIGIHAPIFFIDRDNPNLSKWVAIIEESQRKQVVVRFTYDVASQRLTALELKK